MDFAHPGWDFKNRRVFRAESSDRCGILTNRNRLFSETHVPDQRNFRVRAWLKIGDCRRCGAGQTASPDGPPSIHGND
jgi:hypothetical protein